MNVITNQPINSIPNYNKIANDRPAFTANPKAPSVKQAKKGLNIAQHIYDMMFVPRGEKLYSVKDGFAFTQRVDKKSSSIIGKKYKLYSREPEMTVNDNVKTKIKTKITHKGDVNDVEICDMHTPNYAISAKYEDVKGFDIDAINNNQHLFGESYKGGVKLKYGDKEIKLSNEEREKIHSELDKSVEKRYDKSIGELTGLGYEKFQEFMNSYYQDPEVIGRAILSSPVSLEHQLATVPSSMPYGIEAIMSHI